MNFSQNSHLESLAQRLGMDLTAKKPTNKPSYNSRPPSQRRAEEERQNDFNSAETVSQAIGELSKSEMYQILKRFKEVADKDQNTARTLMTSHPQLPEAILHCMSKLEMIKNALPNAQQAAPVTTPMMPPPQFLQPLPSFGAPPPQFQPPPPMQVRRAKRATNFVGSPNIDTSLLKIRTPVTSLVDVVRPYS